MYAKHPQRVMRRKRVEHKATTEGTRRNEITRVVHSGIHHERAYVTVI